MNSFFQTATHLPGILLITAGILLNLWQLALLLLTRHLKRMGRLVFFCLIHFLFGLFLLTLMQSCAFPEENGLDSFFPFQRVLCSLPWILYAVLELLSLLILSLQTAEMIRFRRDHLTNEAVKDTLDLLPAAVGFGDAWGTVQLANLKLGELCRSLTGTALNNMNTFWDAVREKGEEQDGKVLVHTLSGETWLFSREHILLGDGLAAESFVQILGEDMTEPYRITEELSARNRKLKDVQYRMKMVSARERGLVAAREILKARMAVHDQMGNVLLAGKYYLDHPDSMDEAELLHMLEVNNHFLLDEVEQPDDMPDACTEAVRMAGRIGVRVEVTGKLPEKENHRDLIAQAIEQCAANTVRHAGGDLLRVEIFFPAKNKIRARFTNNGQAPEGPVVETGGLAALRKSVEEAGGSMEITSQPEFVLTLELYE